MLVVMNGPDDGPHLGILGDEPLLAYGTYNLRNGVLIEASWAGTLR